MVTRDGKEMRLKAKMRFSVDVEVDIPWDDTLDQELDVQEAGEIRLGEGCGIVTDCVFIRREVYHR